MKRGLLRLWYRFKSWFRTKPGMGEPLRFQRGSEAELRSVTTWACHINSEVFNGQAGVVFYYTSPCESWKREKATCNVHTMSAGSQAYLETWGTLILKHNLFTGTQWTQNMITEEFFIPGPNGKSLIGLPRFFEKPAAFIVRVYPPSAHERAEALLSLSDWLDGKVSAAEKRELLQLSEDLEKKDHPQWT